MMPWANWRSARKTVNMAAAWVAAPGPLAPDRSWAASVVHALERFFHSLLSEIELEQVTIRFGTRGFSDDLQVHALGVGGVAFLRILTREDCLQRQIVVVALGRLPKPARACSFQDQAASGVERGIRTVPSPGAGFAGTGRA